jgi:hypothetical protein
MLWEQIEWMKKWAKGHINRLLVTQFSFIINSNRDGDPYLEFPRE